MNYILVLLPYYILTVVILSSIYGYGKLFDKILNTNNFFKDFKNYYFFLGLSLVGSSLIIINYFIPITNSISLIIIILGLIIYIVLNLSKNKKNFNDLSFIFLISFVSVLISFFSGVNDDFDYHYKTIKYYNTLTVFDIIHTRQVSYNSHWLFLNNIFSLSFWLPSLFILGSLVYSIALFDLFKNSKKFFLEKNNYLGFYTLFVFIFLIGVMNNYKEFGTDLPGFILSLYIFIFILIVIQKKIFLNTNLLFLFILLSNFALMIKITNSLVYLLLIVLFIYINYRNIKPWFVLAIVPLMLWFSQNIIISNCLIWPISPLCFDTDAANYELYLIESFAKSNPDTNMDISKFQWIGLWLNDHLNKMVEIYAIFSLLLILPIIFFKLRGKQILFKNFFSDFDIKLKYIYVYILVAFIFSNLVWFFYSPAYRFGLFYNLNLILIFLIPYWLEIYKKNNNFVATYNQILIFIGFIFFLYSNINRLDWYFERYGNTWPLFN